MTDGELHERAQEILRRLEQAEQSAKERFDKIMSQLTDLATAVRTGHDQLTSDIKGISSDFDTFATKLQALADKIASLTPSGADAAAVTQIQTDVADIVTLGDALKSKADTLAVPTIPGLPPAP